jgi:hypothetical protein
MRWIKHMTAARSDKAMALVSEIHGPVAIGIYWGLIEEIAGPMEPGKMTSSASHSVAKWASILDTSSRTFTKICKSLQTESLIFCETIGDRLTISIPNILKYKDEYARKSGQTQEQEQKQIRADTEQIQNRAPEPEPPAADVLVLAAPEPKPKRHPKAAKSEPLPYSDEFLEFYNLYPKATTKAEAFEWYRENIKNGQHAEVMAGLRAAMPMLMASEENYRPDPIRWLRKRRFEDYGHAPIPSAGGNGKPDHGVKPRLDFHVAAPRPANAEIPKFEIPKVGKA